MKGKFILLCIFLFANVFCIAQKKATTKHDSTFVKPKKIPLGEDSNFVKNYKPGIAIKRSAMIPGWGQYTNKKYWKIPIVYAGVGIPAYLFFRNVKQYKEAKSAYILATDNDVSNDGSIPEPYYSVRSQPDRIKTFRNEVRQNADYSVLFFILFWGLNVADAAVDAHLKTFNVSDDLTLQFKPGFSPMANTNGVSLVLTFGKHSPLNPPKGDFYVRL